MKDRRTILAENNLARQIVGLAMKVHRILGPDFIETVYRNALAWELKEAGLAYVCHPTLAVKYEGVEVGIFQADLIVDNQLIVELKAIDSLHSAHSAQLINYLAATGMNDGLLLNFGARSLEFRTKTRGYSPLEAAPTLQS